MRTSWLACLGVLLGVLSVPGSLLAHHGNSAYDTSKSVTVTGTVTKWQVINPHSGIWVEVKDDQGNVQVWSGEFGGALDLYRHFRWNKETFKLGDRVTLTGSPAKDGSNSMLARKVILPDGKEVNVAGA
jgi:Family of unknown function (DUF6152)